LRPDQREPAFGIELLAQMRGRFRENHFQRGAHVRAAEMAGKRAAVTPG